MDTQDILRNYNLNVRIKPAFLSLSINTVMHYGGIRYPEATHNDMYRLVYRIIMLNQKP